MTLFLEILPVVMLGAICGLDVVSFPQAMISRPIVASTLAGALLGNSSGGLLVGAVLELIALETLPFGASRYPEWGSASVVGGAVMGPFSLAQPGALPAAVLAALLTASISGSSMVLHRRIIAKFARRRRDRIEAGSGDAVLGVQLFGLTNDLLRGALVTLFAFLVFQFIVPALVSIWHSSPVYSPAVVVALAAIVAASALWRVFHGVPQAMLLFSIGLLGGIGALLLR